MTTNKRFYRLFITVLCLSFSVAQLDAQEIKTNTSGDMIVVFSDGSWRYFDDKSQSDLDLLKAQNQKEENTGSIFDPTPKKKKSKKTKKKTTKKVKNKKSEKAKKTKLAKKKSKKNKKQKTPKYAKGSKKKIKKKTKGPSYSPEVEAEARRQAMLRSEKLLAKESNTQVRLEEAEFNRIFAEEEVKEAYENPDKTNDDIEILEKRLIRAKAEESSAKEEYKMTKREAAQSVKMIDMDKAKRDKMLAKINGENNSTSTASSKSSKKRKNKKGFGKKKNKKSGILDSTGSTIATANSNNGKFKKYSRSEDVMFNPPRTPCSYAYDGFDEFSGKHRKELEKQVFFTFTNDRLKPIFREKDHILCVASLSSIAGVSMLHVEITIASEMAQREFGALDKGSYMSVKLIDGTAVQLVNNKTDIGFLDKFSRSVKYKGRYLLSKDDEKVLMKSEVDKVRVVWGTGFEDYEIYEMDFFRDQLSCLKGK